MYFARLIFPEIVIFFSQSLAGYFSRNVWKTHFYSGLGDVATRRIVGPP